MADYLVVQLARFGDILQTKRLIKSLQNDGMVELCVDEALADLAALVYPDCRITGLPAHAAKPGRILNLGAGLLDQLSKRHYAEVYILNHAGLGQALARLFDPAIVRGYIMDNGQSLRSNWVRLAFRWMSNRRLSPLNLMDYWAWLCAKPIPGSEVNPAAQAGGKGLGVVLAGQVARRSLPPTLLAPIVHAVSRRLGHPEIKLFGTAREEKAGRELMALLPGRIAAKTVNLAGKTDWTALAGHLRGLDLLLGPDTGTIHLAAHLGVPVEALFLSSAWAFETGPYGLGHKVWQNSCACAPCLESAACPFDVKCRKLFSEPAFLSTMSGKRMPIEPELQEMSNDFDSLGQVWTTSGFPGESEARRALRDLFGEYLGIRSAKPGPLPDLYQDTDWILPQYRP